MNGINTETIKSFDAQQAPQGAGKKASGKENSAFKDAMLTALTAGTNVTVLPFGTTLQIPGEENVLAVLPEEIAANPAIPTPEQTTPMPELVMPAPTPMPELGAAPGPAAPGQTAQGTAPEQAAPQTAQGAAPPEKAAAQTGQSTPTFSQAAPPEKPPGHTGQTVLPETPRHQELRETPVRAEAVKQEEPKETKETKQEFTQQTKPQAAADPAKVYVKVGEGNSLKSEKFASDISEKLMARMPAGTQQFTIELNPADLGKILIKLVVQNGRADIIMECANPRTHQLVMANSETIRSIIEERTGLSATVTAKEETSQYGGLDREGKGNRQGGEGEKDGKWAQAETDIFLNHLRLGLTEATEART